MANYRKDIQCLRGLSCFSVIIFHYNNIYLKGGYIGVDIFFLISGYLLLNKEINQSYFYIFVNRCRRLFTTSNIVLLLLLYFYKFIPYIEQQKYIKHIFYSYINIINYIFSLEKIDYYNPIHKSYLLNYWSLSVEIQAYILLLFCKYINLNSKLITVLFILSLAYNFFIVKIKPNYSYFSTICRLWEFSFGGIYRNIESSARCANICFILIYSIFALGYIDVRIDSIKHIIYILITFIFSPVVNNSISTAFCDSDILIFIGDMSYSLYLTHYSILMINHNNIYIKAIIIFFSSLLLHFITEKNIHKFCTSSVKYIVVYTSFSLFFISHLFRVMNKVKHDKRRYFYTFRSQSIKEWHYFDKCYKQYNSKLMKRIETLLLGDSHMHQWLPLLLTNIDCKKNILYYRIATKSILYLNLNKFSVIFKRIGNINRIIITQHIDYIAHRINSTLFNIKFREYIRLLKLYSNLVYIIQSTPFLLFDIWKEIDKKAILNSTAIWNSIPEYKIENVIYIQIIDRFCKNNICKTAYKGRPIYLDTNHVLPFFINIFNDIFTKYFNYSNNTICCSVYK